MLFRRPAVLLAAALLALAGLGGALVAQMESGERGILPIDSSGTLEITGIQVDVGGKDADSARYAGWRIAQREGFKALWAKTNKRPISEAPNLSDSTLDGLVSSIVVEREQIGPNRYIATLGVLFDRARAGELLGVAGRSAAVGADAADPGDGFRRHGDQRRAAQPLAARLGAVPHLAKPDRLCPGQRARRRSAAGQRRPDPAAGPRLVAQHPRSLRRGQHPGRRGAAGPALSGRAGQGAVHRPVRARRPDRSAASS